MATLTDAERAFLEDVRFAVVATINADGTPQQTVLWYELQDETIMMNTARGRLKDRNLLRDTRISFCIEDGQRYLTIRGVATLDDDQERAQADIARLVGRYQPGTTPQRNAHFRTEERVTIRMTIDHVHARGI